MCTYNEIQMNRNNFFVFDANAAFDLKKKQQIFVSFLLTQFQLDEIGSSH